MFARFLRISLIPASAVVLGCSQPGTPSLSQADVDAIRAASASYTQSARDTAWTRWAGHFTEDAMFLPPNLPAQESRATIEAWGRSFPPITDLQIEPLEVEGVGDLAYVRGRYSLVLALPGTPPTPDRGKYIEIWRRQSDGSWKLSRDIYNSDLPLPGAMTSPGARP